MWKGECLVMKLKGDKIISLPSTVCISLKGEGNFHIVADEIEFDEARYYISSQGKLVAVFNADKVEYLFIESVIDYGNNITIY